ncbi:phospholipase D family protein [Arthrobacter pigmenti]
MLDANEREALTQQLRPPAGFRLTHAVGTTFTLDMTSALSVPLSFVAGSGEEFNNPVAVLSAIRKISDRVDIFCQAGHIKAPQGASDLLSLLEPMVHQVSVRHGLFHPKVWVLEFENDDERRYRFLCSSRNLTPDPSWDLLVRLDGAPGEKGSATSIDSGPLARFVSALPELCTVEFDGGRRTRVEELAKRLAAVEWDLPEDIQEAAFRPLGTGESYGPDSLVTFLSEPSKSHGKNRKFNRDKTFGPNKLVISPFLDDELLSRFKDRHTRALHVFGRADQFDLLTPETVTANRATFKAFDDLGVPESAETGTAEESTISDNLTGLHAKAFFCDYSHSTYALLGSANATEAAFTRNVEFGLELQGRKRSIGVERILEKLNDVPFADYAGEGGETRSDEDEARFRLDGALREAAAKPFVLDAIPEPTSDRATRTFAVTVRHSFSPPEDLTAHIRLLTVANPSFAVVPAETEHEHVFRNVPLADVTPYVVLTLTDTAKGLGKSTVVQGTLRTDPDGRLDEIVARQLDDPEKLRQFLLLFLTPEDAPPGSGTFAGAFGAGFGGGGTAGLFEALIGATANSDAPEVFTELKVVIDRLLEHRADDDEIQQLHLLWDAAVEALGAENVDAGKAN